MIVSCLFPCSALMAEVIQPEQAQKVADKFLRGRTARIQRESRSLLETQNPGVYAPAGFREILCDDGTVLVYITELKPRGFIAVSADTDIVPIIAYSFRSSFPADGDRDNPLYRFLTEDMELRTKALAAGRDQLTKSNSNDLWNAYTGENRNEPTESEFRQWPAENTTATGGWLDTAWHQDLPFNDFCPLDPVDGLRSYVGCVATAMAQIVNYHRQCDLGFDVFDSYTSYAGIDIDDDSALYDFPSFGELNGYLSAVQYKYASGLDLDDTDAAALSFACGIAARMDYSSEGSGANSHDAQRALLKKFGFYSADMTGGMSAEAFQLLRENLINGLPVYLEIAPSDGWGGHIVVCDGYNTDGQYHLNFGWGAPHPEPITEVWYQLPYDLLPELSIVTEAILNIQPFKPQMDVDPVSLSFHTAPGQESQVKTLHIQSSVGGVLIDSISSPKGFVLAYPGEDYSDHLGPAELQEPGSSTALRVKFCPDQAGGYFGTLAIYYNDENVKYVALRGSSFSGGTQIPAGEVVGTWSQAGSPYFIGGDIAVRENDELIIEPGVRVVFVGPYGMTIGENARLSALGNQNSPIEFTACNRDLGWRGLRFINSGDDDILSYCLLTCSKKQGEVNTTPSQTQADEDTAVFGAAIYCSFSSPTITSCHIANNESGAIHCAGSSARITNTIIANNSLIGGRTQWGGIFADGPGRLQIKNCTIVNNSPGGIFTVSPDGIEVMNTILWNNDRYQILTSGSSASVSFCDVQDGYPGQGNIDADPSFFDPSPGAGSDFDGAAANWTLRSSSPCINSGRQTNLPKTDLAGNPRLSSTIVDIGAYENQSDLPLITIAPSATLDVGFAIVDVASTVSIEIVNTGNLDVTVRGLSIIDPNGVFSIAAPIDGRLLVPGDSVEARIVFRPAQERVYEGALIVHSTCSNGPEKRVSLRGVGVAGTSVPAGPVSGFWTKAQSPYSITGNIYVPEGSAEGGLTIEPGVVVKFAGHFKFTVGYRATLHAVGTEVENIVFTSTDPNEGWFGIRFVNSGADDVLEYCTLEYSKKNRSGAGGFDNLMGGAILCYSSSEPEDGRYEQSSPTIRNCLIAHNEAQVGAAIMYADGSDPVIVNNRIVDNSADTGGGIYAFFAQGLIANNIIAHNSASVGGGILNDLATPRIMNNTIVHNRPSALHLEPTSMSSTIWESTLVLNNIIWQNEIYIAEEVAGDAYDIRYNDIQGGGSDSGNIDVDPLFADPENRDYHLVSHAGRWDSNSESWVQDNLTSPCIDAGDPDGPIGDELMPHGNRINMGAYGGTWQASKSQQ